MAKPEKTERKRLNAQQTKLKDFAEGATVIKGSLQSVGYKQVADQKRGGELKMVPIYTFEDQDKARVEIMGDAGFTGSLSSAGIISQNTAGELVVKSKAPIEVVKLAQTKSSKGNPLNQYDVFAL